MTRIDVHDAHITSFTGTREFPWVKLGTKLNEATTLSEGLEMANLNDWNVRTEPMVTTESGLEVPMFATVRDVWEPTDDSGVKTGEPCYLGVVGKRYTVWQNEEAFAPVQDILDTSDLNMETAGYKGDGQQAFITLLLPDGILIGGEDRHDVRLMVLTSHDGSTAVKYLVIVGRFACFNQLTAKLRGAKQSWSMRHSGSKDWKIEEARRSLDLTFNYVDEFSVQMNRWLDTTVTEDEFWQLLNKVAPVKPDITPTREKRVRERRALLWHLYSESATNEFGRGTKYAVYNALTEYADWYMPVKGIDPNGVKRAQRAMGDSVVDRFKDRAFDLVEAL